MRDLLERVWWRREHVIVTEIMATDKTIIVADACIISRDRVILLQIIIFFLDCISAVYFDPIFLVVVGSLGWRELSSISL